MLTIGFLACETTLPSSGERRGDAFEHDLEVAAIEPALLDAGFAFKVVDWRAPLDEFADIALLLLGTAWDYQDFPQEFLAKLTALEAAGIKVCNPPEVVGWNMTKTYLHELEQNGAATIPTLWLEDADRGQVQAAMDEFAADSVVVKRQVGAGAMGQHRFSRNSMPDAGWSLGHAAMIQPFLPQIASEGELSLIFIDGEFSHALLKRAAKGEYRIQSLYGGYEEAVTPDAKDIKAARDILTLLPFAPPLYARIDMVRSDAGELLLMETEMIEPYLYPEQGPNLGANLAAAITRKVSTT